MRLGSPRLIRRLLPAEFATRPEAAVYGEYSAGWNVALLGGAPDPAGCETNREARTDLLRQAPACVYAKVWRGELYPLGA